MDYSLCFEIPNAPSKKMIKLIDRVLLELFCTIKMVLMTKTDLFKERSKKYYIHCTPMTECW